MQRRLVAAVAATFFGLAMSAAADAGQIKRFVEPCQDGMCPWFLAVVTPPAGWSEDEEATQTNHVAMLTRDGHVTARDAIMYVLTGYDWHKLSLDEYIKGSEDGWLEKVKDAKIDDLGELKRDGKPAFRIRLYHNPSQPKQAFELTAFTKDVDPQHTDQSFFFQVVLTGPSMKSLEIAKPAFYEILKGL